MSDDMHYLLKIGLKMLWYDDSKEDILAKIDKAGEYYQRRYGKHPIVCYIHPGNCDCQSAVTPGGIRVETSSGILPNHFWIGADENGDEK